MAVRRLAMTAVRGRSINIYNDAGKAASDDDCIDIVSSCDDVCSESSTTVVEMGYHTHKWSAYSRALDPRVPTGCP